MRPESVYTDTLRSLTMLGALWGRVGQIRLRGLGTKYFFGAVLLAPEKPC